MPKKGYLEALSWLAQSIGRTAQAERFVSRDRAIEVCGEGTGQRIDDNLVVQRGRHHRNPLAKSLGMAKVAFGRRIEVERSLATAIDRAHRSVVNHALGDGVTVEGQQRRAFAQTASWAGDRA